MIPDKKLANVIAKSKEGVGLMNSGKIGLYAAGRERRSSSTRDRRSSSTRDRRISSQSVRSVRRENGSDLRRRSQRERRSVRRGGEGWSTRAEENENDVGVISDEAIERLAREAALGGGGGGGGGLIGEDEVIEE
jgi:hypothetical protein